LHTQVFTCGAILGRAGRRLVLHLSQSCCWAETSNPRIDSIFKRESLTSPKLQLAPADCPPCRPQGHPAPNQKRGSTSEFMHKLQPEKSSRSCGTKPQVSGPMCQATGPVLAKFGGSKHWTREAPMLAPKVTSLKIPRTVSRIRTANIAIGTVRSRRRNLLPGRPN
jgi:hypothetical protein